MIKNEIGTILPVEFLLLLFVHFLFFKGKKVGKFAFFHYPIINQLCTKPYVNLRNTNAMIIIFICTFIFLPTLINTMKNSFFVTYNALL